MKHDPKMAAKMKVVDQMRKMAMDEMGGKLKGLKKVSVASDTEEGLKKGLELAKEKVTGMKPEGTEEEPSMEEKPLEEMSREELIALVKELKGEEESEESEESDESESEELV